ncbi:hypothetical protein N7505_007670 [Penicillium chrysogenum]|uniref:Uncharacterized protein n=1 Tax=Penicillium chrysogenum TaxID=5076 RepID=A0ABQ8WE10_PENCH|nr:hypothetical protein N7505_007670 [Penicillium chrysogenum]
MHIGKTILSLCLSSGALSFKVRAFTGEDCSGDAKEVNVWDNTYRDGNITDTRSFRGHRSFWADGGSNKFKKDGCITLDYTARAFGSHSA